MSHLSIFLGSALFPSQEPAIMYVGVHFENERGGIVNDSEVSLLDLATMQLREIIHATTAFEFKPCSHETSPEIDGCCILTGDDGSKHLILLQVKRQARSGDVDALIQDAARARGTGATLLFVAPMLDAGVRRALREAAISHADLGGTLFLRAPGVAVRVDGAARTAPRRAGGSEPNPFADRASLVLRAMMREPDRPWGVRELALALGISAGLASQTADELARRGYAASRGGRVALADAGSALVDWAALKPWAKNRVRSFVAPFGDAGELARAAWRVAERLSPGHAMVTQLAALDEYAPHVAGHGQVHLYCAPGDFDLAAAGIAAALYAEPVRRGGNLHLVRPSARRSTGFDARERGGMRVVSPVQLFLDLAAYPVRGPEGAGMLARAVLGPELGLSPGSLARILGYLDAR